MLQLVIDELLLLEVISAPKLILIRHSCKRPHHPLAPPSNRSSCYQINSKEGHSSSPPTTHCFEQSDLNELPERSFSISWSSLF